MHPGTTAISYSSGRRTFKPTTGRLLRLPTTSVRKRCIDAAWVLFIIGTAGAANSFGFDLTERYFWFVADLAIIAVILTDKNFLLRFLSKNKLLLSLPILACVSTVWSASPGMSLYHGIQLLMTTLIAFMFCIYESRTRLLQLIFIAFLLCAVWSLLLIILSPETAIARGGEWKGVFNHKNSLGGFMVLLVSTGACLFLQGWRRPLTFAGITLGLALIIASQSSTSFILLAVVILTLPLGICFRYGRSSLSLCLGVVSIFFAVGLTVILTENVDVIELIINSFGKDKTLSGRTILWDLAIDSFQSRPLLGLGYKGFWESTASDVLRQRHGVGLGQLWFFHNNFLEVAVAFGIVGLILLLAVFCQGLMRSIAAFIADRQYTTLWSVLIVLLTYVLMFSENPLFENHSLGHFLFVVAVAAGRPRKNDPNRFARPPPDFPTTAALADLKTKD